VDNRDEISKHRTLIRHCPRMSYDFRSKSDARDSTHPMQEKQCFAIAES